MSTPFFFLELGHHNFFFAPGGQETKGEELSPDIQLS